MLRDLLVGELGRAPGVQLTTVDTDLVRIRESVAATSPDWVILELEDEGLGKGYIELFDLRPSLKMLVLADHTARAVLCIQLGELSPTTLLRALAQIRTEEWVDVAR